MTIEAEIAALLADDELAQAVDRAVAHLKARPQDHSARLLLVDLLILSGDLARADKQAEIAGTMRPQDAVGLSLLRNQLRGIAARHAWFGEGALPAFPKGPTALDRAALKIGVALREGDHRAARAALEELEALRNEVPGSWNGASVSDLRDLDDRIPHAFEAITTGGAYLWVDFALIEEIVFQKVERPRDLAYRRARLTLVDGASAEVLVPAIYPDEEPSSAALSLGRETDWVETASGIVTGRGLRSFLAGDGGWRWLIRSNASARPATRSRARSSTG